MRPGLLWTIFAGKTRNVLASCTYLTKPIPTGVEWIICDGCLACGHTHDTCKEWYTGHRHNTTQEKSQRVIKKGNVDTNTVTTMTLFKIHEFIEDTSKSDLKKYFHCSSTPSHHFSVNRGQFSPRFCLKEHPNRAQWNTTGGSSAEGQGRCRATAKGSPRKSSITQPLDAILSADIYGWIMCKALLGNNF